MLTVGMLVGGCTGHDDTSPQPTTSSRTQSGAETTTSSSPSPVVPPTPSASRSGAPSSAASRAATPTSGSDLPPAAGSPVVTSTDAEGGQLQVSGYVPGVIVDGQACVFTLVVGSSRVERTTTSLADAAVTTCPSATFSLAPGATATVTLRFGPNGATSDPVAVVGR